MSTEETTKKAHTNAIGIVPSHATFTLTLSKLYRGSQPVIPNAVCEFSYIWDFQKNMGLAHLNTINKVPVNIVLHPLGIAGYLDFMSDMPPTPYVINGQRVILNRIILDINRTTNERSGGIMFNQDGSVIQTTPNFDSAKANF